MSYNNMNNYSYYLIHVDNLNICELHRWNVELVEYWDDEDNTWNPVMSIEYEEELSFIYRNTANDTTVTKLTEEEAFNYIRNQSMLQELNK